MFALLRAKADPKIIVEGKSPLKWAAIMNQIETVDILIKYGAELNECSDNGNALHLACYEDHPEMVEHLLKIGIKLDDVTVNGDTPLHICAQRGALGSY
jgi:ankyrin repeat protein